MSSDKARENNLFLDLAPTAKRILHQTMVSGDPKLARDTAQDVLDRAGMTKKSEIKQATQIVITNSQVEVLMRVADEVEAKLEIDQLYEPSSKELKNVTKQD